MKYKLYLALLLVVTTLSGCGEEDAEEIETETQTDTYETLHITIEEEISEKQEKFYEISSDFEKYLIDYSAYGLDVTPVFFIQLFEENGDNRYYLKANGNGEPCTSNILSYEMGYPLMLIKDSNDMYLAFHHYMDASVTEWSDGSKDGLYFFDEALNEIKPKNLVNAISITDFAKINNIPKENIIAILNKNDFSVFTKTYKDELQTLSDCEKDWTEWKHSTFFYEDGPIYEGTLTEEYILSALSDDTEITKQKERDLLVEKEALGVQNVYQIINEDKTVSYISQDGNDMIIKEDTESSNVEDEMEQETEEPTTAENEETVEDYEQHLPKSLFDKNGVEYVFYSEIKNIDNNGNVYYEIMPLESLQSLVSYIKIYYNESTNTHIVSGVQFAEKEYENALEDYYLSLDDITLNAQNKSILKIGDNKNEIKFFLYDPDNAYVNKKIFTLDKEKTAIFAVVKEADFLEYTRNDESYKEISFEEFNILNDKIQEFIQTEENTDELSTEDVIGDEEND